MDWLKLIYENLGAKAPTASIFIVTLLGAIIFGGGWWLLGKQYEKDLLKQPKPVMEGGPRVAIRPGVPHKNAHTKCGFWGIWGDSCSEMHRQKWVF
jgi:hypothetical protein